MMLANDHDLIVRLDTKMDGLGFSITDVKAAIAGKADASRADKFEKELEKLEGKLESIQLKVYMAMGGLAALQVFIHLLWK